MGIASNIDFVNAKPLLILFLAIIAAAGCEKSPTLELTSNQEEPTPEETAAEVFSTPPEEVLPPPSEILSPAEVSPPPDVAPPPVVEFQFPPEEVVTEVTGKEPASGGVPKGEKPTAGSTPDKVTGEKGWVQQGIETVKDGLRTVRELGEKVIQVVTPEPKEEPGTTTKAGEEPSGRTDKTTESQPLVIAGIENGDFEEGSRNPHLHSLSFWCRAGTDVCAERREAFIVTDGGGNHSLRFREAGKSVEQRAVMVDESWEGVTLGGRVKLAGPASQALVQLRDGDGDLLEYRFVSSSASNAPRVIVQEPGEWKVFSLVLPDDFTAATGEAGWDLPVVLKLASAAGEVSFDDIDMRVPLTRVARKTAEGRLFELTDYYLRQTWQYHEPTANIAGTPTKIPYGCMAHCITESDACPSVFHSVPLQPIGRGYLENPNFVAQVLAVGGADLLRNGTLEGGRKELVEEAQRHVVGYADFMLEHMIDPPGATEGLPVHFAVCPTGAPSPDAGYEIGVWIGTDFVLPLLGAFYVSQDTRYLNAAIEIADWWLAHGRRSDGTIPFAFLPDGQDIDFGDVYYSIIYGVIGTVPLVQLADLTGIERYRQTYIETMEGLRNRLVGGWELWLDPDDRPASDLFSMSAGPAAYLYKLTGEAPFHEFYEEAIDVYFPGYTRVTSGELQRSGDYDRSSPPWMRIYDQTNDERYRRLIEQWRRSDLRDKRVLGRWAGCYSGGNDDHGCSNTPSMPFPEILGLEAAFHFLGERDEDLAIFLSVLNEIIADCDPNGYGMNNICTDGSDGYYYDYGKQPLLLAMVRMWLALQNAPQAHEYHVSHPPPALLAQSRQLATAFSQSRGGELPLPDHEAARSKVTNEARITGRVLELPINSNGISSFHDDYSTSTAYESEGRARRGCDRLFQEVYSYAAPFEGFLGLFTSGEAWLNSDMYSCAGYAQKWRDSRPLTPGEFVYRFSWDRPLSRVRIDASLRESYGGSASMQISVDDGETWHPISEEWDSSGNAAGNALIRNQSRLDLKFIFNSSLRHGAGDSVLSVCVESLDLQTWHEED